MELNNKVFSTLSSFEQNLVILYDLDLNDMKDLKRLRKIKHQSIIDYYLTDIHYIVVKRYFESEKNKELSDEELERIIRDKRLYISSIPTCFLKEEDIRRISIDVDYLSKYNELYSSLPNSSTLQDTIISFYAGNSKAITRTLSTETVKKHMLLDRLDIGTFLKEQNKTLDEKLSISRQNRAKEKEKAKRMIDNYKSKFSA